MKWWICIALGIALLAIGSWRMSRPPKLRTVLAMTNQSDLAIDAIRDGRLDDAMLLLGPVIEDRQERARGYYNRACAHALAGHQRAAMRDLKRAFRAGYSNFVGIESDPDLDSIRARSDFRDLITTQLAKQSSTPITQLGSTP